MAVKISVIVPVYKEESDINRFVEHIFKTAAGKDIQIVIADGEYQTSTLKAINFGFSDLIRLAAKKGRATQMNAAASLANGDVLLFLHADTKLPEDAFLKIEEVLKNPLIIAGAFSLKLDSKNLFLKFISFAASLRSQLTKIPYGDQAIFIRRNNFNSIGGYKDIPLMEDIELMKRIKINGWKIKILATSVISSARKWEKDGLFLNTLKNNLIRVMYWFGISPDTLYRIYYGK